MDRRTIPTFFSVIADDGITQAFARNTKFARVSVKEKKTN